MNLHVKEAAPAAWFRAVCNFSAWTCTTLFWVAVAPFVLAGGIFWLAWLNGLTGADLHRLLVDTAAAAPHQAWTELNNTVIHKLIVICMVSVFAWRVAFASLTQELFSWLARWIATAVDWALLRLVPRWLSSAQTDWLRKGVGFCMCIAAAGIGFTVAYTLANGPELTKPPHLPKVKPIAEKSAAAAISLPDGQIHSGGATVSLEGERWIIEFSRSPE